MKGVDSVIGECRPDVRAVSEGQLILVGDELGQTMWCKGTRWPRRPTQRSVQLQPCPQKASPLTQYLSVKASLISFIIYLYICQPEQIMYKIRD